MGMEHSGWAGWLQPTGAHPAAPCAAIICSSSGIGWSAGGRVRLWAGSLVALTRSSKPARGQHEETGSLSRRPCSGVGHRAGRRQSRRHPPGSFSHRPRMSRHPRGVRHLHDRQVSAGVCRRGLDHGQGTEPPARLPLSAPHCKRVDHRCVPSLASSISRSEIACRQLPRHTLCPVLPTRVPQSHKRRHALAVPTPRWPRSQPCEGRGLAVPVSLGLGSSLGPADAGFGHQASGRPR